MEGEAFFDLPGQQNVLGGRFSLSLLQNRGRVEQVSVSYAFDLGAGLQDSVAAVRVREGPPGANGRLLLELPAFPGVDGGPPRVHSGLAPTAYAGPVEPEAFVGTLLTRETHVTFEFLTDRVSPVSSPLQVEASDWHDSCT